MRTIAPLQLRNLTKSFAVFFILSSAAWFTASYVAFRDLYIGWIVLVANVMVSVLMGWWWYRRHHHAVLRYDDQGLELQVGRAKKVSEKWQHFTRVSLVHEGYGRFAVRLYETDGKYIDIPASDLKLRPSDFRFEVMDLVKGESPAEGSGARGGR
jgi:hypothetical protein